MFESLSEKIQGVFAKLRGQGTLTEDNISEALREVRRALLEADVNLGVVKAFVAKVKEFTGGKLCDVVYDGIGKTTFPASLDCIRPLGYFVSFGSASGQIEAFNINILQAKGSLFATRPTLNHYAAKREDLMAIAADLFSVVGSGAVKIPVNQKYALKDARKAHEDLEGRGTTGSSILIP